MYRTWIRGVTTTPAKGAFDCREGVVMHHLLKWLRSHSDTLHHGQHYGHLLYFAAVFADGHGLYAFAAAGMLVLGIFVLLSGQEA